MADNKAFHRPADIGYFDLAVTQIDEVMTLSTVNGSFLNTMKIVFLLGCNVVKTYTVGNEIIITAGSKEAVVTFQGADFAGYVNQKLKAEGSFFKTGEVTIEFALGIVKTNV